MKQVSKGSDSLTKMIANLRNEMEAIQTPAGPQHFRGVVSNDKSTRNFSGNSPISSTNWRTGSIQQTPSNNHSNTNKRSHENRSPTVSSPVPARYQSHFTNKNSLEDKILNEIIQSGEDVYYGIYRIISSLICSKDKRKWIKSIFLPIVYGLSVKTLANDLGLNGAQRLIDIIKKLS